MRLDHLFRLAWLALLLTFSLLPRAGAAPGEAHIDALVAEAAAAACTDRDRLVTVMCRGVLRVGVRVDYAGFAQRHSAQEWVGFEVDLARDIAARLDVLLELVPVTPANRIAMLAEGRVDAVITTMGHTRLRDGQVRFIRPHYYSSRTVIVGDRRVIANEEESLPGRTICVTIGNADTVHIAGEGARLLLFDSAVQMLDALRLGICTLVMQDDTFFAPSFADPAFRARFDTKMVISSLPWGMATAHDDRLAQALDALSAGWHEGGHFLEAARRHGLATGFLETEHARWAGPDCVDPNGVPRPACLSPPVDPASLPSAIAPRLEAVEHWLHNRLGLDVTFPILKSHIQLSMVVRGIVISLLLVAGSLMATLGFALAFARALCAQTAFIRIPTRALVGLLQGSPIVMLLFFGYAAVSVVLPYATGVPVLLAIVMIGLYNGSHAADAIADAHVALSTAGGGRASMRDAAAAASVQIMSFLVNATKSTSIASMIGVPELLNALTDITSFTSERVMTYSLLLLFYASLVVLVVRGTRLVQRHLLAAEVRT